MKNKRINKNKTTIWNNVEDVPSNSRDIILDIGNRMIVGFYNEKMDKYFESTGLGDYTNLTEFWTELPSKKKECPKCGGEGWLWRYDLDEYSGPALETGQDDTRYLCDHCSSLNVEDKIQFNINSLVRFKNRVQPNPYPLKVLEVKENERRLDDNKWWPVSSLISNKEWEKTIMSGSRNKYVEI